MASNQDDFNSAGVSAPHQSQLREANTAEQQVNGETAKAERDVLEAELHAVSERCQTLQSAHHALHAENQRLSEQFGAIQASLTAVRLALDVSFPFEHYREIRPDLKSCTDEQLIDHFVSHGRNEGSRPSNSELWRAYSQALSDRDDIKARLEALERHFQVSSHHLEFLKEMFFKQRFKS